MALAGTRSSMMEPFRAAPAGQADAGPNANASRRPEPSRSASARPPIVTFDGLVVSKGPACVRPNVRRRQPALRPSKRRTRRCGRTGQPRLGRSDGRRTWRRCTDALASSQDGSHPPLRRRCARMEMLSPSCMTSSTEQPSRETSCVMLDKPRARHPASTRKSHGSGSTPTPPIEFEAAHAMKAMTWPANRPQNAEGSPGWRRIT